jgi:hypothetical protein
MYKVTCERGMNSKPLTLFMVTSMLELITRRKVLPEFFLCIFSSLTYLKKDVFSKRDLLRWKVPARLYWDFLTSGGYRPACHYFEKLKKSELCFT